MTLALSASADGPSPATKAPLSVAQKVAVDRLADVYRADRGKAEENYRDLIGQDRGAALKVVDELAQKKHFEIAALAITDINDQGVRNNLIRFVLAEKIKFSRTAFAVAIRELEQANSTDPGDDGEAIAGNENTKAALASAIARWLSLPDPKLRSKPTESKDGYTAFIARARGKAATIAEDAPN